MSYPVNYPTPQGANVQIFYGGGAENTGVGNAVSEWVKPQGASFVWFTLIGAGGGGDPTLGPGGSGAITNCLMPAFLIPDKLEIVVGYGLAAQAGRETRVIYNKDYELLRAEAGSNGAGGSASSSNYFSAAGFFQSVAGVIGTAPAQNPGTFLTGGSNGSQIVSQYGYVSNNTSAVVRGYFQMQPIIVGVGGTGTQDQTATGGIGCGGGNGNSIGAKGGNGLCVIISW